MEDNQEKQKLFGIIPIIEPDSTRAVPIVVGSILVVFIIVIIIAVKSFMESNQPRIVLQYAPMSAIVTVDGKVVESGEIVLSAGAHEVKAEKYGFETVEETVELEFGEATPVNIAMGPNMEETQDWYLTHTEDSVIADGIGSERYDTGSQEMMDEYPIINKLPVVTNTFAIYQQSCDEPTLCIYIDTYEGYYDTAIEYFRSNLDSDVGKYNFIFRDYSNPFLGEG